MPIKRYPQRLALFVATIVVTAAHAFDALDATGAYEFSDDAYVESSVPQSSDLGRFLAELALDDGEKPRVRRENLGGDETPEWIVAPPRRLCGADGCQYAVFDGASGREIGRFHGTLVVRPERINGYPLMQTLLRQGDGYSSLRSFRYAGRQYHLDEELLISESARLRFESALQLRR